MHWLAQAHGSLVADWNVGAYLAHTDPYLVWLDLTRFAGAALAQGGKVPVIAEYKGGARFRSTALSLEELRTLAEPALRDASGVQRFEVAPGTLSDDLLFEPAHEAADAAADAVPRPAGERAVVGFIDYGCGFAHRQFRRGDDRLGTRVKALWDQGGSPRLERDGLQWRRPPGYRYGAETHRDVDWSAASGALNLDRYLRRFAHGGTLDEQACYRHSGYEPVIGRSVTHGTHVMDLATGYPSPLRHIARLGMPGPQAAHDADIVFVQLPRHIGGRQVGGLLRAHVFDAVDYIVECTPPHQPAVINLSYGANAGPHDGSSVLECALDWRLRQANQRPGAPRLLVVAAGNAREQKLHAQARVAASASACFVWNNLPDDPSDSFVELWWPRQAGEYAVRVTPPGAASSDWLEPGRCGSWHTRDGVAAALVLPRRACQSPDGCMALLAVSRTRPMRGRAIAPYGAWRIELHNRSQAAQTVHAWCERDTPAFGSEGLPRQGCFSATPCSTIGRNSTLNSVAHGQETIVVGGHAIGGPVARYSGTGPGRGQPEGSRLRRAAEGGLPAPRGPDLLAPSDESAVLEGLMAAALIGTDKVRLAGTSAAAAVATRRIVESGFKRPPGQAKGPRPDAKLHPDSDLLP